MNYISEINCLNNNCLPSLNNLLPRNPKIIEIEHIAHCGKFRWDDAKQIKVLEALKEAHFWRFAPAIKTICLKLQPLQLHHLLKAAAENATTKKELDSKNKTDKGFHRLSELLSIAQIEAAARSGDKHLKDTFQLAKEMSSGAKYYLGLMEADKEIKPFLKVMAQKAIWAVQTGIDALVTLLDLEGLGEDETIHPLTRKQSILAIGSAITACATVISSFVGSPLLVACLVGTTIALATAVIYFYFKHVKPAPRLINGCQNLTTQALGGQIKPMPGRQQEVDQIAATLLASRGKTKTHPLLIGPTGVGKTEVIKTFAAAVANGHYPALKNKQVFYINAADLKNNFNIMFGLDAIKNAISHRREDVILVFDEIHQMSQEGGDGGTLSERLKTLLDDGEGNLPYVIGATTDEEFEKHMKPNRAFIRRFKPIPIKNLNKEATLSVLNKKVLNEPGMRVTQATIASIYEHTKRHFPKAAQPDMSLRILSQAISKAKGHIPCNSLNAQIIELETEIEKLTVARLLDHEDESLRYNVDYEAQLAKLNAITEQLEVLKKIKADEDLEIHYFHQFVEHLEEVKRTLYRLSCKIVDKNNSQAEKQQQQLKEFLTTSHYLHPAWKTAMEQQAQQAKTPLNTIDKALISKVVQQEITAQKLTAQAIEH